MIRAIWVEGPPISEARAVSAGVADCLAATAPFPVVRMAVVENLFGFCQSLDMWDMQFACCALDQCRRKMCKACDHTGEPHAQMASLGRACWLRRRRMYKPMDGRCTNLDALT